MTDSRVVAYAKPPEQRDEPLLHVGQQCSSPTCSLIDFLPIKCPHCSDSFCTDHFKPDAHDCKKYDASKYDRVAPSCPLCNTPVAIPPGQDPNLRMERHINSECSVMTGKSGRTPTMPLCGRAKCGKKLFAPIKCDKCHKQFCPEHRYPTTHTCVTTTASSSKPQGPSNASPFSNLPNQTSAASAAALAALKRAAATASTPTSSSKPSTPVRAPITTSSPRIATSASTSSNATGSSTPNKSTNPFSKQNRRAEAERKSQRKAELERRKREGKKLSAAEQAEAEELGKDKKDCVVM